MASDLKALVTGASRGIGAATALKLAQRGYDVALNFRNKAPRAEQVAQEIAALGRSALLAKADITIESEVAAMMSLIGSKFGHLDALILNASGGLESGKAEDYAMTLNYGADECGSQRCPITEGRRPHCVRYQPLGSFLRHQTGACRFISRWRRANALAKMPCGTMRRNAAFRWLYSGDAIEGTITPRLLIRKSRGHFDAPPAETRPLPTVDRVRGSHSCSNRKRKLVNGHTISSAQQNFETILFVSI